MSWRTIYITQGERMGLYLDNLLIVKDNIEYKIPLSDIGNIIVENINITITLKLLNKILEYGILLIICDEKHNPNGYLNSLIGHFRQGKIIENQLKWEQHKKNILWKNIVYFKLDNQKEVLKKLDKSSEIVEKLSKYQSEVREGDRTNREGIGAKVYFKEMFGEEFIRGNVDIINSALDYGYTVFNSKISRVLASKGLLTYLGIHHKNEYNQFNLASDIIEVYRPIVDYYVAKFLMNAQYFGREDRIELVNLLNTKILQGDYMESIGNSLEKYIDMIIKYFETGDLDVTKIPSLKKMRLYEL